MNTDTARAAAVAPTTPATPAPPRCTRMPCLPPSPPRVELQHPPPDFLRRSGHNRGGTSVDDAEYNGIISAVDAWFTDTFGPIAARAEVWPTARLAQFTPAQIGADLTRLAAETAGHLDAKWALADLLCRLFRTQPGGNGQDALAVVGDTPPDPLPPSSRKDKFARRRASTVSAVAPRARLARARSALSLNPAKDTQPAPRLFPPSESYEAPHTVARGATSTSQSSPIVGDAATFEPSEFRRPSMFTHDEPVRTQRGEHAADHAGDARPQGGLVAFLPTVVLDGAVEDDPVSVCDESTSGSNATKITMNATYVDDCEDGTAELNQYVLLEPLGKGTQGEVFLAMDTEKGELRAVKAVHRPGGTSAVGAPAVGRPLNAARRRQREQLEREVAIMKRCRHKHVVALYEVIDDPEQDRMYLVMQYVHHGPVATVACDGSVSRTVAPDLLVRYARQLADGLGYLHGRGVIHRDIKPENILLGSDEQVYLADFGTAEAFEGGATARVEGTRGTLAFVAPELLAVTQDEDTGALSISINAALSVSGEASSLNRFANASWAVPDSHRVSSSLLPDLMVQHFPPSTSGGAAATTRNLNSSSHQKTVRGEAVDVWALGVTLYALLYGELPFFGGDASLLFSRILTADASFQSRSGHSSSSLSPGVSVAGGSHLAVPGGPSTSPGQPAARRPSGSTAFHPSPTSEALVLGDAESAPRQEWRKLLRGMLRKDPALRWTLADVHAGLERIEAAYRNVAVADAASGADDASPISAGSMAASISLRRKPQH